MQAVFLPLTKRLLIFVCFTLGMPFAMAFPQELTYQIIKTYPHDAKAYTQCLEFYNGVLLESTGNGLGHGTRTRGISSMRQTDFSTGKIIKIHALPKSVFGEGCTVFNKQLFQLTYKNNVAYRYNPTTLTIEETLPYFKNMEGWGLTHDKKSLYMSDGSDMIYQLNPKTFKPIRSIGITLQGKPFTQINELEWVNDKIYANVYRSHDIVVINPQTGVIEQFVNLKGLQTHLTQHPDIDVLNGIAYHQDRKTFFVTGKNWDKMFEIRLLPKK